MTDSTTAAVIERRIEQQLQRLHVPASNYIRTPLETLLEALEAQITSGCGYADTVTQLAPAITPSQYRLLQPGEPLYQGDEELVTTLNGPEWRPTSPTQLSVPVIRRSRYDVAQVADTTPPPVSTECSLLGCPPGTRFLLPHEIAASGDMVAVPIHGSVLWPGLPPTMRDEVVGARLVIRPLPFPPRPGRPLPHGYRWLANGEAIQATDETQFGEVWRQSYRYGNDCVYDPDVMAPFRRRLLPQEGCRLLQWPAGAYSYRLLSAGDELRNSDDRLDPDALGRGNIVWTAVRDLSEAELQAPGHYRRHLRISDWGKRWRHLQCGEAVEFGDAVVGEDGDLRLLGRTQVGRIYGGVGNDGQTLMRQLRVVGTETGRVAHSGHAVEVRRELGDVTDAE